MMEIRNASTEQEIYDTTVNICFKIVADQPQIFSPRMKINANNISVPVVTTLEEKTTQISHFANTFVGNENMPLLEDLDTDDSEDDVLFVDQPPGSKNLKFNVDSKGLSSASGDISYEKLGININPDLQKLILADIKKQKAKSQTDKDIVQYLCYNDIFTTQKFFAYQIVLSKEANSNILYKIQSSVMADGLCAPRVIVSNSDFALTNSFKDYNLENAQERTQWLNMADGYIKYALTCKYDQTLDKKWEHMKNEINSCFDDKGQKISSIFIKKPFWFSNTDVISIANTNHIDMALFKLIDSDTKSETYNLEFIEQNNCGEYSHYTIKGLKSLKNLKYYTLLDSAHFFVDIEAHEYYHSNIDNLYCQLIGIIYEWASAILTQQESLNIDTTQLEDASTPSTEEFFEAQVEPSDIIPIMSNQSSTVSSDLHNNNVDQLTIYKQPDPVLSTNDAGIASTLVDCQAFYNKIYNNGLNKVNTWKQVYYNSKLKENLFIDKPLWDILMEINRFDQINFPKSSEKMGINLNSGSSVTTITYFVWLLGYKFIDFECCYDAFISAKKNQLAMFSTNDNSLIDVARSFRIYNNCNINEQASSYNVIEVCGNNPNHIRFVYFTTINWTSIEQSIILTYLNKFENLVHLLTDIKITMLQKYFKGKFYN